MRKDILIEKGEQKNFYQETRKYIYGEIDAAQFVKDNVYYSMIEEVYRHHFAALTDESSIKNYVEAGADIYRDLNEMNVKLKVAYGGTLDGYLLHLIAGQFFYRFDGSEVLAYEDIDSLVKKIKRELRKASSEPYSVRKKRKSHNLLNTLIENERISHQTLIAKSGLSGELLAEFRSGRRKCTKDVYYILALTMRLRRREFERFAAGVGVSLDTPRDELILSYMDNMLQIWNMPENKNKTTVELMNYILGEKHMELLSCGGRKGKKKDCSERTILITGGMGFIGRNCIDYFNKKSDSADNPYHYKVCIASTSNAKNDSIPENTDFCQCNLNDEISLERILLENDVDYIIHLAAIPIPENAKRNIGTTIDVNAQALNTLCNVVLQNHIPVKGIIFTSTEHVYGNMNRICREDTTIDEAQICTPYAHSKFIAENIAHNYAREGVRIVIARLSNIYGKYDKHIDERLIPKTIHCLLNNKPIDLFVDQSTHRSAKLDFLYAGDLVRAFYKFIQLFENPENEYDCNNVIYNIGSGNSYYVEDVQKLIMSIMGKETPVQKHEMDIRNKGIMDVEKAGREINFTARTSLEEGLKKTIDWCVNDEKNNR